MNIATIAAAIQSESMTWHRVAVWDEDLHRDVLYRARRIEPEDARVGDMVMVRNAAGAMFGRKLAVDQDLSPLDCKL
jgi:hypothetical protein